MGGLLSKPETTKQTIKGEGLGLKYGISSMQGWRPEMEDAHDIKIGLKYGLDDWSYFAVFDGHAGKRAAAYAAWNLLDFILRDSRFELELSGTDWHGPVPVGCDGQIEQEYEIQEDGTKKQIPLKPYQPPDEDKIESSNSPQDHSSNGDLENKLDTSNQKPKPQKTSTDSEPNDASPTEATTQDENNKPRFATLPVLKQLEMVQNAIKSGFLTIDQNMRMTHLDSSKDASGCTAVCALISPTHLFIANCGDSRAVLFDGKKPKFATEDHKPSNPKERERIVDAGGVATQRINGSLAVSRALGDFEFKKDELRGPCEQLVSPEPDVTVIERHPSDEFLILACDGIWDVMDNDDLCQYVRHQLTIEEKLENVCSSVLDVCLHKGSRDNMSIILVVFENGPKVSELEIEKQKLFDELLCEMVDELFKNTAREGGSLAELSFAALTDYVESEIPKLHTNDTDKPWPPGAGIEGKYNLLRAEFDKQREKYNVSDHDDTDEKS